MYNINDNVMYGRSGVCKIIDITTKEFGKIKTEYYILEPVFDQKAKIYCPVNSDRIVMRKLLSYDEVKTLIADMPDMSAEWIDNDQARKEKFSSIVKNGDHVELIKLIKVIHARKCSLQDQGKKLHIADERAIHDAEKLLYEEFAHVLDIKTDEVVPFIAGELEAKPL